MTLRWMTDGRKARSQALLWAGTSARCRKYTTPQNNTLTYLIGDHPGSTSLAIEAGTGEVIETRYNPCPTGMLREGEVRYTTENMALPTRDTLRQAQAAPSRVCMPTSQTKSDRSGEQRIRADVLSRSTP
jgi:hypothetical protein